tara:strand:- start:1102 stop:1419 length:318 start_codon:yes stop_codon:yes gene_type:complete
MKKSELKKLIKEEIKKVLYENEDDMMNDEEVKEEVLSLIQDLKSSTNYWSTRDTLIKFTRFSFWDGGEMASIDIETANDIADKLFRYVKDLPLGDPEIDKIYELL